MTEDNCDSTATTGTVTISHDNELRVNAALYHPHFADYDCVRLGRHPSYDLIFIRPIDDPPDGIADTLYKIDDTRYTGEISCQTFLQKHDYHHETTTQYFAEWWNKYSVLCVDLTDPSQ